MFQSMVTNLWGKPGPFLEAIMVASLVACSFPPCSTRFSKLWWQSQGHTFWTLVSQWPLIVVDLAGIKIQNYYTTCTEGIKIFLLCRFVSYAQIECSQSNTARNGVPRAISDAMKSFPSGHAQLSTHCAVFVILYVQSRIGTHFSSLWKHFLQMVFLVFALVCSLSRIVDKRHHWWDVLAGMLIGATFAYVTVSVFTCSTSYCIIVDIACPLSIYSFQGEMELFKLSKTLEIGTSGWKYRWIWL